MISLYEISSKFFFQDKIDTQCDKVSVVYTQNLKKCQLHFEIPVSIDKGNVSFYIFKN